MRLTTDDGTGGKIPKAFHIVKDRIRSMSKYEKVHIALFFPYMLKHTVGDFASIHTQNITIIVH